MINFLEERENNNNPDIWKQVYGILSKGQRGIGDAIGCHSIEDITEVQLLLYDKVLANKVAGGERFICLDEARTSVVDSVASKIKNMGVANDSFYNPVTGVGTFTDPNSFTAASIPVSISPFEATSIYSSGGIPAIITDKKSKGVLVNGVNFLSYDSKFWTDEKIEQLIAAAHKTGLIPIMKDCFRDATIYAGDVLFPMLKRDSVFTLDMEYDELLSQGYIGKDCISYWTHADRWNLVFVPNWNITAQDYLYAKRYYIPISGFSLNTSRACTIRPKQLPYWGAMRQMGWGVSDFEGYIRSLYAYYTMMLAIPIMAQQMSLLLYQIPMDALISQIGVDNVKSLMEINEQKMREWSILNPKAVNMVGEVFTVNRTFSGFEHFVDSMINNLCAEAEIPRPLLFHTPAKGFSDNTQESLFKESEMMRQRQRDLEPSLANATRMLVAHTFGTDSEEYAHLDDLYMSFDKPVVATEKDKAEIGARYSAMVASFKQSGVPTQDALVLARQFAASVKIPDEMLKRAEEAYKHEQKLLDDNAAAAKMKSKGPPNDGIKTPKSRAPQLKNKG